MLELRSTVFLALIVLCSSRASGQTPPAEPRDWTATVSAGFALTSGNANTSTVNASYDITYGRQTNNIVKSDGLLLRGTQEGELSTDRLGLNVRDEFQVNDHAYVFGENRYLRDRFKSIDYLLAPSAGLGYKVLDQGVTRLSFDAGIGGVWEKNLNLDVTSSGIVTIGERYEQRLTATTSVVQSYSGLWRTQDLDDSLHVLSLAAAIAVSQRMQFKVEALDTYKSRPPDATIRKNDVALLFALVYSF